ncbi:hypothetical protein EMCRGX_G014657 [Ephydatia muelleri]
MAQYGYGQAPGGSGGYTGQPAGGYSGQPAGGYPGQQAGGYPGQPGAGYPGQPAGGYPGQPGAGYPGQPAGGYPGQPGAGYPGQPAGGYPGQPGAGYPGQPAGGYPGQPAGRYPGQPGAGQPAGGYPGQQPPGQYSGYGAPAQQTPPPQGVDPTVYSWFAAVDSDRSGSISATELQQALTNNNWTHFNAETCRLMIALFDHSNTGKIGVQDFAVLMKYVQQWKALFERYDTDRSGNVEAGELHRAYNEMGYRVSPQFCQLVVARFDLVERRRLKLDDFIQSCVMIQKLTDSFKQRDTNRTGIITVGYEDFLSITISGKP